MSRHRNVRSMNYHDEYAGYDDVYGHSVEDEVPMSPTSAQYMFDRNADNPLLDFFAHPPTKIEEEEEGERHDSDEDHLDQLQSSSEYKRPQLSDIDEARLNSCLEELHNILGDSVPDHVMVDAVLNSDFNYEQALSVLFAKQETPKPQREPRSNTRNKGKGAATVAELSKPAPVTVTLPPLAQQQDAAVQDLSSNVARMTFSSGTQAQSGFSPVKDAEKQPESDQAAVEAVKRELKLKVPDSGTGSAPGSETGSRRNSREPSPSSSATATPKRQPPEGASTPKSTLKSQLNKAEMKAEFEKRKGEGKNLLNLVVIGHVDAGKSTLMGHVLYQLGCVNKRTMHKYEQESKKMGKASFAYAWILDETEEERVRGVTMDVAQTKFETNHRIVTLLDAPGHKDFIPNMITGAAQADVAILVVNAARGEFETGFELGGQTREHALLIRSLGVSQLAVAINKMDMVEWSQERYNEITKKLGQFLKQAGFKEADLGYIPCSGLNGDNLAKLSEDAKLLSWYKGGTVVDAIDAFQPPDRPVDKPLRMCVSDVFKGVGTGSSISGNIQAGCVQPGDKVLVMPQGEVATVKNVIIDEMPVQYAFAGDTPILALTGIDMTNIGVGSILSDPVDPIQAASRIQARVVIFNIDIPITKGFPVVFHYQSLSESASIYKLISQLHKSTGEVIRKKPRCLTKNSSALVEIEIARPVCVELYKDYKDLGRFMLRSGGATIAAGLVTEILESKGGAKAE